VRDPARIARISEKLLQVWQKYPDLRLGQLITNLGEFGSLEHYAWFIEDDHMEQRIDAVLAKGWAGLDKRT